MTPMPYAWPHTLVFWAVFVWAFLPEVGIVRRARRRDNATDAKSLQVIAFGTWAAYFTAFPIAWVPILQFPAEHRVAIFYLGIFPTRVLELAANSISTIF